MPTDPSSYAVSIHFDRRLYRHDIAGSLAHARMLSKQGIITVEEASAICDGLDSIRAEIEADTFPWRPELEDIHMNIEARLTEQIGPVAGKLHTARSRNDQVALDMRMYAREVAAKAIAAVTEVQRSLLDQAQAHPDAVMPGYTHLQRAQPVLLAHHLLAYFEMLQRDVQRFREAHFRADVLPLGSGALAGSPYPLNREWVAQELGFSRVSENSMDAVSDRDFVLDYLYAASVTMTHLSRLAEELVLWSSEEFGFVRLADEYTTGSSMMPQKRNPDFAELARGRTGRVYGRLMGLLTTLKGLPLTYHRDLQEDKEALCGAVDTLLPTLEVFGGMLSGIQFDAERMGRLARGGHLLATDLADYLVRKGMPFRQAHGAVAELSRYAVGQGKGFERLNLEEYRRFSDRFEQDVFDVTAESSVAARDVPGGTAPQRVREALVAARQALQQSS